MKTAANQRHRALRVLIVDDSDVQLQFEQALLGHEHFDFLLAHNGAEAVNMALKHQPDLILLDIEMPVMNGLEAARRIREDRDTGEIPIIMVTGRGSAEHLEKAFIGGCNDYVIKPIHKDELLAKIFALTGHPAGTHAS